MPSSAPHKCNNPRCRTYTKQRLCDPCAIAYENQRNHSQRDPEQKAFYGSAEWQAIREEQLVKHPFCQALFYRGLCNRVASHVDHKVARTAGGTDGPENLQSLCLRCHSRKTAMHDGGFGNKKRSA